MAFMAFVFSQCTEITLQILYFFKTCSLFIILPFISEALIYFLCGIASCLCSHTTPHPKCCSCCQVQTFILKM